MKTIITVLTLLTTSLNLIGQKKNNLYNLSSLIFSNNDENISIVVNKLEFIEDSYDGYYKIANTLDTFALSNQVSIELQSFLGVDKLNEPYTGTVDQYYTATMLQFYLDHANLKRNINKNINDSNTFIKVVLDKKGKVEELSSGMIWSD